MNEKNEKKIDKQESIQMGGDKNIKKIKIDLNSMYKDLDDKYSDINSNISKNSNSMD